VDKAGTSVFAEIVFHCFWFKRHSSGLYLACTSHLFLGSDVAPTESDETPLHLDRTNGDNYGHSMVAKQKRNTDSFENCSKCNRDKMAF
jgi:hypothetical protein